MERVTESRHIQQIVTGNMNVIDWNTCSREWSHFKRLEVSFGTLTDC